MAEKLLIPAYKRTASCARCGAVVYAPDMGERGGWPLMSACACPHGPQLAAKDSQERKQAKPAEQAQAA